MNLSDENIPLSNLINLSGKTAIVTGAAAGIGLAISCRLAEAGVFVVIADINADAARKAAEEIKSYGYKAHFAECDVSSEEKVRDTVSMVAREAGGIDILVNNAGIYPRVLLSEMTGSAFDRVVSVNLKGTFLCSQQVSQRMIEQGRGGCIINIASIEAVHPSSTGMSAYDASKGGALMLTKSLARELGRHGIRVNAIAPGGIMTQGAAKAMGTSSEERNKAGLKELKVFMARMVLGRMGEADDIARVALFLASELSSYMTGEMVVVDGGYLIS